MAEPKYPNVRVNLTGTDGNAFALMGRVAKAMRRAGIQKEEIDSAMHEAMSGDYDHLLVTLCHTVDVH